MKSLTKITTILAVVMGLSVSADASPTDCYVVNFRNTQDMNSIRLDEKLPKALKRLSGFNIEEVVFDDTTPEKWEEGAHKAIDSDIFPVFNQWIGLPGFAAIVDANSKRVIGCVKANFSINELTENIKLLCARTSGDAYISRANFEHMPNQSYVIKTKSPSELTNKTTKCPAPHNVLP